MTETTWLVRAGREAVFIDDFLEKGFVSMGLDDTIREVPLDISKKDLIAKFRAVYPGWRDQKINVAASQFIRFCTEPKKGDMVVTFDPGQRRYILGTIDGDVRYSSEWGEQPYRRAVTWKSRVAREVLSVGTRNSLGAIQTLFRVPIDAAKDLVGHAIALTAPEAAPPQPAKVESKADAALLEDLQAIPRKAELFIEDQLANLDWEEMQELIAGILRAMGYKARVSPKGSDRGVDIFASPDGLGLQEPRIFVEVKHRLQTPMSADNLRAFLGGRKAGDRCLYVSTGGFTKEARYEAERSMTPLTLIDLPEVRKLFLEYYDRLDEAVRAYVPLQKIYWPSPDLDE